MKNLNLKGQLVSEITETEAIKKIKKQHICWDGQTPRRVL